MGTGKKRVNDCKLEKGMDSYFNGYVAGSKAKKYQKEACICCSEIKVTCHF